MSGGPWLAVGLGNPGDRYAGTRHNIGQMAIERMAAAVGEKFKSERKVRCDVASIRVGDRRLLLAGPHSYMNESGGPVSAVAKYYDVPADHLIVLQDEIDLPFGALRVKFGGGDNGHNGLRSIRKSLGTGDWYRVRIGVGRGRGETADHVLSRFGRHESAGLDDLLQRAADCTECLVTDGLATAQNRYNS